MTWPSSAYLRRGVLLVVLAAGLAWLFAQSALFQRVEGWNEDAQHRLLGPTLDMSGVVVVDIDEESIEVLKQGHGAWPYSRDLYAQLVTYLVGQGVKVLAFDILFAEPRDGDDAFAAVIKDNAVLAAAAFPRPPLRTDRYLQLLSEASLGRADAVPAVSVEVHSNARPPAVAWPDVTLPIESFMAPGRGRVAIISARPDEDGTLRRIPLFHEVHGYLYPGFSLAAWASREDLARMTVGNGYVQIGGRAFSVSRDGEVRPRFPGEVQQLTVVPFHRLVHAAAGADAANTLRTQWNGKTVFIGSSSILFGDYAHTPMGRVSGLVLSAIIFRSLDAGHVLRPVPQRWLVLLVLLATVPALLWMHRQEAASPASFLLALVATVGLVVPVGMGLFYMGWLVSWLLALSAGLIALTVAASYAVVRLRSDRERLAFERVAAQEAARMKGEFLAHMAHELRTPLTAILGFNKINQINDQIGSAQRRKNSAIITANCEHLLKLVNDNLDLATIEAGQMTLSPSAHSPEDLVNDVISTFGPLIADKGLALEARFERPLPAYLNMDAMRVRQVLLNVLGNAVKFTERGRVDVLARWRDEVLDLTVTDTGPGIDPQLAARMFEPFQRGDPGRMRRLQGTGLGLGIARSLVRLMGGDLALESWPGQGSRFRFWLPAPVALAPTDTDAGSSRTVPARLSGYVLLAEDDEDIRLLMQRELDGLGVRSRIVANGIEAVRACEEDRFDLILMDLEMPAMSGLEAIQVIRARGVGAPVIALTAHGLGTETDLALRHGFDAILVKPVHSDALALRLAQYLDPTGAGVVTRSAA